MRNSRFKNNIKRRSRKRMVWNFLKKKFNTEPELTIDQLANYPTKQKFTIFKQEDEDERYERHMNPIRKAQEKTVSQILQDNLEPINKHGS